MIKCFYRLIIFSFISTFLFGHGNGKDKEIKAVRINSNIKIDGLLNEPEWKLANPVNDFIQKDPIEGQNASEKTEISVLFDDENLYFGCKMYESDPSKIIAQLARRDNEIESDDISIRIDTYHDHKTCYEFTILASGTKVDILQYNDAANEDKSWDAVWEVETKITEDGWSAELKIPFKILRFNENSIKEGWGINFLRGILRKNETDYWVLIKKNQSGFISHFGHLIGLDSIKTPTRLELLPYVVSSERFKTKIDDRTQTNILKGNAGLDLKYGITSNTTLDLTINPDFGQVEADPAVLNLSTFETYYPEKRPFFIEGTQILRFSGFNSDDGLFYSRRIGRVPNVGTVPDGSYIKTQPDYTTILAAAKITGKNENGLSFGILNALTNNEYAKLVNINGTESNTLVEPLANYFIARAKQDLPNNSVIGGIVTSVLKNQTAPAFTGGLDWNIKFMQSIFQVDGFLALSKTLNYYNNRDMGSAGRITFAKTGGDHWLYSVSTDFTAKNYNINDVGFFRRPNDHGTSVELAYKEDAINNVTKYWKAKARYHLRSNFDNANLYKDIASDVDILFLNYYELTTSYSYSMGEYDDRETRRKELLYKKPKGGTFAASLRSDGSKQYYFSVGGNYGTTEKNARNSGLSANIYTKPLSNIILNFAFSYAVQRNNEAFVTNIDENGLIKTIFGNRNTDQFSFNVNGSLTFTKDLTFELYSQLFFAKGNYSDFRWLITPETFHGYNYSGDPDFNKKNFQINTVLRWEYLPGSIFYLVWSQSRNNFTDIYDSSMDENFSQLFRAPMDNTIMIKFSYWMNI